MAIWGKGQIIEIKESADMSPKTDATPYTEGTGALVEIFRSNFPNQIKDCVPLFKPNKVAVNRLDCNVLHDQKIVDKWIQNWVEMHSVPGITASDPKNIDLIISFFKKDKSIEEKYNDSKKSLLKMLQIPFTNHDQRNKLMQAVAEFQLQLNQLGDSSSDPSFQMDDSNQTNSSQVGSGESSQLTIANHSSQKQVNKSNVVPESSSKGLSISRENSTISTITSCKKVLDKHLKNSISNEGKLDAMMEFCKSHDVIYNVLMCKEVDWWSRGVAFRFVTDKNLKTYIKYVLVCVRCYAHHYNRNESLFIEKYCTSNFMLFPSKFRDGCICNLP